MTSTSRTTTTTTRPIRRPFIPRARPSSRPPRQPVTPTPGRTSTIRRQHHMIIPVMNGEFKSCSADTFSKYIHIDILMNSNIYFIPQSDSCIQPCNIRISRFFLQYQLKVFTCQSMVRESRENSIRIRIIWAS